MKFVLRMSREGENMRFAGTKGGGIARRLKVGLRLGKNGQNASFVKQTRDEKILRAETIQRSLRLE